MDDVVIRAEKLGKIYRLGRRQTPHDTLRDRAAGALRESYQRFSSIFSRSSSARTRNEGGKKEYLQALKDVSFEVRRGEAVGLVGRNGAGKTTLLKVLSRITEPTEGYADINGRVGSLLEVGTGVHPELTGRENIYLNGAILGMKKAEIDRVFDDIVAFAEVDRFLDTPLKRYSSGMTVRLAFAVAAHMEPEILLVDEVLSVGDAAFQKKSLGRMDDAASKGKTVIFVSHNMGQIRRLCERGLWIDDGKLVKHGSIADVIEAYLSSLRKSPTRKSQLSSQAYGGFATWRIVNADEKDMHSVRTEGPLELEIEFGITTRVSNGRMSLALRTEDGYNVAAWNSHELGLEPGVYTATYSIPSLPVRPGLYHWYAQLWDAKRKVDASTLSPELVISTQDHAKLSEWWTGLLNIPCRTRLKKVR